MFFVNPVSFWYLSIMFLTVIGYHIAVAEYYGFCCHESHNDLFVAVQRAISSFLANTCRATGILASGAYKKRRFFKNQYFVGNALGRFRTEQLFTSMLPAHVYCIVSSHMNLNTARATSARFRACRMAFACPLPCRLPYASCLVCFL